MYLNRGVVFVMTLSLCLSSSLLAQTQGYQAPELRTEIFGGFSLAPLSPGRFGDKNLSRVALPGWAASVTTYQFFRRWGLTAEFSGNSGSPEIDNAVGAVNRRFSFDANQRTALFGGTYRALQRKRFALTGRILAGVTNWEPKSESQTLSNLFTSNGIYPKQNAFTFGFGQAIDLKFSENVALRVQPDLRIVRLRQATDQHRTVLQQAFSIGVVYKFGK